MRNVLGVVLLALLAAGCGKKDETAAVQKPAQPIAPVAAPAGVAWVDKVAATPDGGFVMGNPDAPVKLVEYGSLSCSHCAAFDKEGVPALKQGYVATGKVSYEFRNYVRDGMDLALALLARCQGPDTFFPMSEQMFAAQSSFFDKVQTLSAQQQQTALSAGPKAAAEALGLDKFAEVRGLPSAKAGQCLADQQMIAKLTEMNQVAVDKYNLTGTPTFVLNGKTVEGVAAWDGLEPVLRTAVGG